MAATAQADPYSRLLRAIGYSVGGELLVVRVKALVDMYVDKREINALIWNQLVEGFGRKTEAKPGKKAAAEHMADMYSSLGFLIKIGNQLFPGPALDALSILKRDFIEDERQFDRAVKAITCLQILDRDGDIFVNCLAASFKEKAAADYLNEMLQNKRQVIAKVIKSPDLLKRVLDKVSIKNLDAASKLKKASNVSPFAKRTTPLMGGVKVEESISKDYIRKVPARRRRWAEDIELFEVTDKPELTDLGNRFLAQLSSAGLNLSHGGYAIWAYEADLLHLRIFPDDLGIPNLRPWDLCEIVAGTYADRSSPDVGESDLDNFYAFLTKCKSSYAEGNKVKGSIRHQVPIDIVQACLLGIASSDEQPIVNMPACVELETKGKKRRFSRANIRGTEGAIEVKSKGR
jgi:hypothetical protein